MATAIHSARPLGSGRWQVRGNVDGDVRAVTFAADFEPTMEQCAAALRGERIERELREPAPPPTPKVPGAPSAPVEPPADPQVAALLDGNVAAVSERVAEEEDGELLQRALDAENAGTGRKTAIAAIEARLEELTD